ncbi:hypothetical protein EV215_0581 [Hypnocyclicus thermotrophus]|uniref:Uncharacterized protein n=1 Tax=Hypnocyclicus thermotrophus TaxID=1627895 RepID=A0AA46DZS5_9FUSO|nr:hypothetical protein [Hypnocyclicus thermotrophus]TDT71889.1 hypothetical protein EV215_0581 [Hypnocyclicus thermotrophus]
MCIENKDFLDILREKDYNNFEKEYNKGMLNFLIKIAPFTNKRTYFKIYNNGNIIKYGFNKIYLYLAFLNEISTEKLIDFLDKKNRIKFKKIDRLSGISTKKLSQNIFKIFYNRDFNIAIKYCKELYLKDKNLFIELITKYVLMNDIYSEKSLFFISFIELTKYIENKNDIDYILYPFIYYLVNRESDFYEYENSKEEKIDIETKIFENYDKLLCLEGLNILAYYILLKKSNIENKDRYYFIILNKIDTLKVKNKLSKEEEKIIGKFLNIIKG